MANTAFICNVDSIQLTLSVTLFVINIIFLNYIFLDNFYVFFLRFLNWIFFTTVKGIMLIINDNSARGGL